MNDATQYNLNLTNKVLNKNSNIPHMLGLHAAQGENILHNSFYSNGGLIHVYWQPLRLGQEKEYTYQSARINGEVVQLPVFLSPSRNYTIEGLISYTPIYAHNPTSAEIEAIRQSDIAEMHRKMDMLHPRY